MKFMIYWAEEACKLFLASSRLVHCIQKKKKKHLPVPKKRSTFVPDYSAPGSTKCFLSD